ncbi:hypothetical protein [Paenibacillus lemnae]|uniref:Uncharacterized protein n=1 Tax=Paenibacillus lemnae TaxID=1330551 RepID=A0A848M466_PAELE|nr:hypothetical protein [Paenibacillus lemnae]NMO95049.1 hypothetical protein [Paenibacillus lemnae]
MNAFRAVSSWVYDKVNWKWTLAAVAIFICFMIFVLPQQAEKSEGATGSGESPDSSFVYTAEDLYRIADIYGEEGRKEYIQARFTFDIVWPLVYLFFLCTLLTSLYRFLPERSRWRFIHLLPLGGWLFDLLENLGASLVMYRYPQPTPVVAQLTPVFTLLKWMMIYGSFAAAGIGIILLLIRAVRAIKTR